MDAEGLYEKWRSMMDDLASQSSGWHTSVPSWLDLRPHERMAWIQLYEDIKSEYSVRIG